MCRVRIRQILSNPNPISNPLSEKSQFQIQIKSKSNPGGVAGFNDNHRFSGNFGGYPNFSIFFSDFFEMSVFLIQKIDETWDFGGIFSNFHEMSGKMSEA